MLKLKKSTRYLALPKNTVRLETYHNLESYKNIFFLADSTNSYEDFTSVSKLIRNLVSDGNAVTLFYYNASYNDNTLQNLSSEINTIIEDMSIRYNEKINVIGNELGGFILGRLFSKKDITKIVNKGILIDPPFKPTNSLEDIILYKSLEFNKKGFNFLAEKVISNNKYLKGQSYLFIKSLIDQRLSENKFEIPTCIILKKKQDLSGKISSFFGKQKINIIKKIQQDAKIELFKDNADLINLDNYLTYATDLINSFLKE